MADFLKRVFSKKNKKRDVVKEGPPPNDESPFSSSGTNHHEKVTKDDFESLEVLGKGTFAHVVLARHKTSNKYYAMKVVNKQGLLDHKRVQDVFTERNVLTRSNHPYLLKLHYTFQSEHKLFFVMDFMAGGDLDKYLNSQPTKIIDPETSRLYACEIFMAITYLHDNGVIYRDLKPENILIDREGHCALADFGLSKDFHVEGKDLYNEPMRCNSFVGSPFYVAPDVLKKKEYTVAVDLWSLGILLYRMVCGRPPFSGTNMKEVFENILFTDLRFPSSVAVAPELRDLISRLLIKDANKRIKAHEVRAHPYWNGLDFDAVYQRKVHPLYWKVIPTVEEIMAAKAKSASNGNPPNSSPSKDQPKQPLNFVNTPINTTGLQEGEQQMFQGFSCTTDSVLRN
eukprot:Tbor_TRINITY_DN5100_c2_g1::TRINITY_DN5100_c2_g1_i13::g.26097::m.26097/K04456/AKT; RAC serine/threonine-protein kinase